MNNFKPRVFIFIDWFYPGYKSGGPVQSILNLIRHLKNEFDFFVLTRNTDYCETQPYTSVNSDCWNKIDDGFFAFYLSNKKLSISFIKHLVNEINPNIIYINGIYSFWFSILPMLLFRNSGKKIIVGTRGMLASGAMQIKSFKKHSFIKIAKHLGFYKKISFHATNSNEVKDIKSHFGEYTKVILARNLPDNQKLTFSDLPLKLPISFVNIARIAPEKNLLFALKVLQKVSRPLTFDIFGPIYNEPYWEECKNIIKILPKNINVNYCGVLPSDKIIEQLKLYHFMFMPTLGENFGHIILQSFAASTPVIISNRTPWKDLEKKQAGFDLDLNKVDDFVNLINKLTELNPAQYHLFREGAFSMAYQYYSDPQLIAENKNLLAGF